MKSCEVSRHGSNICACSIGDHLLLEASDLRHVGAVQFVSMRTLTVSGEESDDSPRVYITPQLSSQLHSTDSQPLVVRVLLNEKYNPDILLILPDSVVSGDCVPQRAEHV